jgi:hypothetical protein
MGTIMPAGICGKAEGFGKVVLVVRPPPKTEGFAANSPGRMVPKYGSPL